MALLVQCVRQADGQTPDPPYDRIREIQVVDETTGRVRQVPRERLHAMIEREGAEVYAGAPGQTLARVVARTSDRQTPYVSAAPDDGADGLAMDPLLRHPGCA